MPRRRISRPPNFISSAIEHIAINGQKGYHGVAIVSRLPIHASAKREFCGKGDSRHMHVTLGGAGRAASTSIISTCPPAATSRTRRSTTNSRTSSPSSTKWRPGCATTKSPPGAPILVGDLNIAPLEHDVWSHKALLSVVSHTPIEVEKLGRVQAAGAWVDALRKFVPDSEKLYTWWSYRSPDWALANKGRRLDHVWVSAKLGDHVRAMEVLRDARGWERTSDHAPVKVALDLIATATAGSRIGRAPGLCRFGELIGPAPQPDLTIRMPLHGFLERRLRDKRVADDREHFLRPAPAVHRLDLEHPRGALDFWRPQHVCVGSQGGQTRDPPLPAANARQRPAGNVGPVDRRACLFRCSRTRRSNLP